MVLGILGRVLGGSVLDLGRALGGFWGGSWEGPGEVPGSVLGGSWENPGEGPGRVLGRSSGGPGEVLGGSQKGSKVCDCRQKRAEALLEAQSAGSAPNPPEDTF